MRSRVSRRSRSGTAAVEFAIVAPLLFLLILGMIEVGRMVMVQQSITNATREGAREACLEGATKAKAEAVTKEYLDLCGVKGATVAVDPDPETAAFGDSIEVKASISFDKVSWLPGSFFFDGIILEARSVMRSENP